MKTFESTMQQHVFVSISLFLQKCKINSPCANFMLCISLFGSISEAPHLCVEPFLGFSLLIHMQFISFHSIWFSLSRRRALEIKWSKFDMFPLRNAIHHQIYCENIFIAFPCCSPLTWFTVSLLHRNELNHKNGILPTFGRFCSDSISCRFSSALYSLG